MPETKPLEEKIQKAIDRALYANGNPAAQKARNFLNGTWLGVPLHVVLKDVPIGACCKPGWRQAPSCQRRSSN